ncbi:mitochondrial enolase superfamily member 1 [Grus japonensis]|uniref:Mitochondrial enolase superfamily member 1 n=1 Tax=Grus japonensis TaxID=30415 RepID=A0ABC9Y939_GRUJA
MVKSTLASLGRCVEDVISFFSSRLEQAGAELSVERVLEIIKQGAVALPKDRLRAGPQETQTLEVREKVWRKEDFPLVEEDWVREHLGKRDIHKSMGPDGMHPQVLRELADVIARPLSIIFERSWRTGEVPVTLVFKKGKKEDPGNYRPVSLTSIPGKVMEQLILGVTNKHVEEKKVIGSGQQ